ncbi:hypothetical protein E1B22_03455 [Thermaerobacter sp. FW80]|uniref:SWIM zinc finger family protein n=1 Tax=Thermaerobacter sp. FW80 TaxID=2546351 RepID=UPI0010752C18|nr:hypothetical protein [Thermaerobacter sp. FW80]QBS37064.1 hypothetical protein E1B22_03455 [Thermaerobacter sp. FW80]
MDSLRPGVRPTASALMAAVDEAMLQRLVPEPVRIRALDLFLLGRVESRLVSGTRLLGEVRGSRGVYRTVVHVLRGPEGPDAAAQCECPRRARAGLCKHAVALLYAWIHEPATFASLDDRLRRLEERPRGQLLELIHRLVEEEPALLATLDAAGAGPHADTPDAAGGPGEGEREGEAERDEGSTDAPSPARWVLQLERQPDPEPEEVRRWLATLAPPRAEARSPGRGGGDGAPTGAAGPPAEGPAGADPNPVGASPGAGDDGEAAGLRSALSLLLQGALWRQAGLAVAARARGEAAAARWLEQRWQDLARTAVLLGRAPRGPASAAGAECGLTSVVLTAQALGVPALLAASRFLLEGGHEGMALGLARCALERARTPAEVADARARLAQVWLARGQPERALPYLAANFTAQPDAERLAAVEAAARAAGQWDQLAPEVAQHLEALGDAPLLAEFLRRQGAWDELAARLDDPAWRGALPTRLLLAIADGLRRRDPARAAALYREAMARPDAGDPRAIAARWEALAHRLGRDDGLPPGGPDGRGPEGHRDGGA